MVTPTDDELQRLSVAISRLPHVSKLYLHTLQLSDANLDKLAPLKDKIEVLAINELFQGQLNGSNFESFSDWTKLRNLLILSGSLNKTLNLEPLASLPNLTNLTVGTGTLDEKAFVDISKIKQLQSLSFIHCRFTGEYLRHLQRLPNLESLTLQNIHPEIDLATFIDMSESIEPDSKPKFRFERSHDWWVQPKTFPTKRYQQWLKEVLPDVKVGEFFDS